MPPYQYAPYHNPLVGSIAEIMLRRGDVAAQGAQREADIRARGIEQQGAIVGQGITQAGGAIAGSLQQQNDPQRQLAQQQVDANKRSLAYGETATKIASSLVGPDGEAPDPDKISRALTAAGIPVGMHKSILEPFESMDRNHKEAQADAGAFVYRVLKTLPADASAEDRAHAAAAGLGGAMASGLVQTAEAKKITDALANGQDPLALAMGFMSRSPSQRYKETIQDETKPFIVPGTPRGGSPATVLQGGRPIAQGAPGGAPAPTPASIALAAAGNDPAKANELLHPKAAQQPQGHFVTLDGKPRTPVVFQGGQYFLPGKFDTPIDPSRIRGDAPAQTGNQSTQEANAKETAAGIKDGTISPQLLESTRATEQGIALTAELHRQGVNTDGLLRNWMATKRAISSLNSTQQLRLAEVINKASESLDKLDELNQAWADVGARSGIKVLNRASLKLAQNGVYGKEAASIAQRLDGQIADVTSELGQAVMGGNSPTDHALDLASHNLGSDWDQKVLSDSIKQVRYNLNLAQNARNAILEQVGVTSTQVHTPAAGASTAPPPPAGRMRVVGPKGETGTMPVGEALPPGWKKAGS